MFLINPPEGHDIKSETDMQINSGKLTRFIAIMEFNKKYICIRGVFVWSQYSVSLDVAYVDNIGVGGV